jgi:uncharacterized protein YlxW (UPF0749 family)
LRLILSGANFVGINAGVFYALLLIVVGVISVAAFFLGRKKEATESGLKQGTLISDISYIKQTMDDMKSSVDKLDRKLDDNRKETEKEIRDLLVSYAELNSSYKSLHKRIDALEQKLKVKVEGGEI